MSKAWFTASNAPPDPHMPHGWRLIAFDSLDSTNAALRRIVEQDGDAEEGLTVWARSQTAGRGRAGRTWASPPGNLYASILIAAPTRPEDAPQVGFVAAVAVADTIMELPRHNAPPPIVACKWPNDLLVDGKKVCGILPEVVAAAGSKSWVILGIGVNLQTVKVEGAPYPVTALGEHSIDVKPARLLTVLLRNLERLLSQWRDGGFQGIRTAWLARAPVAGTGISVGLQNENVSGTFAGLDEDGALLLDTPTGRRRIVAGDVLFESA